jgi:hypothetical protein
LRDEDLKERSDAGSDYYWLLNGEHMIPGLTITAVDVDDDYLGLDIAAASERFAGSARIFAGYHELSEFAKAITGFPARPDDKRTFEFGIRDAGRKKCAGGFVRLEFRCTDGAGHPELHVAVEDDAQYHAEAASSFAFPIEAAEVDRFVAALQDLERDALLSKNTWAVKPGHATLPAAGRSV